jgi:hypothetical protein
MTAIELKHKNYSEAARYLDNAKDILKTKAKKHGDFYDDQKYVRMAAGAAYSGVLLALDAYLLLKGKEIKKKSHQRKSVDDYNRILSEIDSKLLNEYKTAYGILHLYCYYDGNTKYDVVKSGMESAENIIKKIKPSS